MAERVINQQRRRSEFIPTLIPTQSFDELVKDKLVSGKFPLTKTGWIKIIAVIISLVSLSFFLTTQTCSNTPDWYPYLFPSTVGSSIVIELLFYIIFSTGCTVKSPGKWVIADISLNLICAVLAIVGSTLTTVQCTENETLQKIPGPLGITGGILSIIGCGAIFLMYRYVEDEEEEQKPATYTNFMNSRKSIQA